MKREFRRHKKSAKWTTMQAKFEEKCKKVKQCYSTNIVNDLKMSNPSQWHSKIKRMTSHSQEENQKIFVQEIFVQKHF